MGILDSVIPNLSTFSESRGTRFSGCLEGIIFSVDDPERNGRVQVVVPALDPNNLLPSGEDNWIQTTTEFTVNAGAGGSHHLLEVGTQVVLIPKFGRGSNWIVFGVVHSRVDQVHPDFNRSRGLHGGITRSGVFTISDEENSSRLQGWPNGVIDAVSSTGDRLLQTAGGARAHLDVEGNSRIESPTAFTTTTAEGEVIQRSGGGAQSRLNPDGTAEIQTPFGAVLRLEDARSRLTGPLNPISAGLSLSSQYLQGPMGRAAQIFAQIGNGVLSDLSIPGLPLDSLASLGEEVQSGLEEISSQVLPDVNAGLAYLQDTLDKLEPETIGEMLRGQIESSRLFAGVTGTLEELVSSSEFADGRALAEAVIEVLPEDLAEKLSLDSISKVLDGLSYDPKAQIEAILDGVLDKGIGEIGSILGMGFEKAIAPIQELLEEPLPILEALAGGIEEYETILSQRTQQLQSLLPERWKRFGSPQQLREIIEDGRGIEYLLGVLQRELAANTSQSLEEVIINASDLVEARRVAGAVRDNDLATASLQINGLSEIPQFSGLPSADGNPQEILRQVVTPIAQLRDRLLQSLEQVNQLSESAPPSAPGAEVLIENATAELRDPTGINRVQVGQGGVQMATGPRGLNITTPWGSIGFSALGGTFFSPGTMAMLAKAAGLLFHEDGSASLAAVDSIATDDDGKVIWSGERARVFVIEDKVYLQSLSGDSVLHELFVSPEGVWADGRWIHEVYDDLRRFEFSLATQLEVNAAIAATNDVQGLRLDTTESTTSSLQQQVNALGQQSTADAVELQDQIDNLSERIALLESVEPDTQLVIGTIHHYFGSSNGQFPILATTSNRRVSNATIVVTRPYNAGTTISVGTTESPGLLLSQAGVNAAAIGEYTNTTGPILQNPSVINLFVGGSTTAAGGRALLLLTVTPA